MWRRVETDYKEAPDEAERLEGVARILSEAVYAYLRRRGLLTANRAQLAEDDTHRGHWLGGRDSP